MMLHMKFALIILFAVTPCLTFAQKKPVEDYTFPWVMGETIIHKIFWLGIPVGSSEGTARWVVDEDGRNWVQFRMEVKSNSVISKLYPVYSGIESLVDPDTLLPSKFTQNRQEGRHKTHEVTVFDHANGKATMTKLHKEAKPEVVYEIDKDTQDIISFMYMMRGTTFEPSTNYAFRVMSDEKIYDLTMTTHTHEKVKLKKYGKVKSLKAEPDAAFKGVFNRSGKISMWFSTDSRSLLTKMVADTPFANVKMLLVEVHGPGDDFWTKDENEKLARDKADSTKRLIGR
ncbi:MAG: hypothetical protein ACI9TH_001520 [Kiritimatiellia bacterium]|jgi:hypothetical protein